MIDFTYWIMIMLFALLFFAFLIKEFYLATFASMGLMVTGVYVSLNGLGDNNNLLTQTISITCIVVGAYVMIRGWIEKLEDEV